MTSLPTLDLLFSLCPVHCFVIIEYQKAEFHLERLPGLPGRVSRYAEDCV